MKKKKTFSLFKRPNNEFKITCGGVLSLKQLQHMVQGHRSLVRIVEVDFDDQFKFAPPGFGNLKRGFRQQTHVDWVGFVKLE